MAVRRERVILELQDDFSPGVLRAATATKILQRELNSLSGKAVQADRTTTKLGSSSGGVSQTGRSAETASRQIDRMSGRMMILADIATALGPALVPVGAVAVPAVTGLANQLGVAALAGGTAIAAFQGVGDALKAVNEAALEPTHDNLAKAGAELAKLSPAAQDLVRRLHDLGPALKGLRDTAATGMFPGLIAGIDALEGRLPDVERIVESISTTLGDMLAGGGESLASGRWDDFFEFLATDASATLVDLGSIVGDLTHGLAEMWMGFSPLNNDFSSWMVDVADSFDRWATGLDQTEGFQEFVEYIRATGPQVADTMAALGDAVLQIVEASAPLGGPVLQALEGMARAIATIANSDIGTPLIAGYAAMRLLTRGQQAFGAISATTWAQSAKGAHGYMNRIAAITTGMSRAGAAAGMLALSMTDVDESMVVSGAAMGTLAGLMIGGPWGAAVGGGVGLLSDFSATNDDATDAVKRLERAVANGAGFDEFASSARGAFAEIAELQALLNRATDGDAPGAKMFDPKATIAYIDNIAESVFGLSDVAELTRDTLASLEATGTPVNVADILTGASAVSDYSGVTLDLSDNFLVAATSAADLEAAIAGINEVLTGRSAMRDYEEALDKFTAGLEDNGRTLDINTQKGRDNEEGLDAIAAKAIVAAETLDAADRPKYLRRARKDFLAAAEDLRIPKKAAEDLADELGLVGDVKAKPKVDLEDEKAKGDIKDFAAAVNNLDGDSASVKVTANTSQARSALANIGALINAIPLSRTTVIRTVGAVGSILGNADGGTIPGQRAPYGDKVLTYLAPGEEVISNRSGQADRNRSLLKAINDNRMADGGTVGIQALASGGTVSGGSSSLARTLADFERALKRSEKALDKEKDARDGIRDKMTSLSSSVGDKFDSDLFGQSGWGAANPTAILRKDIADSKAFNAARSSLMKKGVDSAALDALLSQGSLTDVQSMAGMSKTQLKEYEVLFNRRTRQNAFTGSHAAAAAYGPAERAASAAASGTYSEVKHLNKQIASLTKKQDRLEKAVKNVASGVGKEINGAASRGKRNQSRGRA